MIKVLRPGLLTTIQDLGRHGYRRYGVITSGAMDSFALRIGNLLVGNAEDEGGLEMTLVGPRLKFEVPALISITGKGFAPRIDGVRVPTWRPIRVESGSVMEFESLPSGCRSYLCVAGGFSIPPVMDSVSTYLRAGIGGFSGRALQTGDVLPCRLAEPSMQISQAWLQRLQQKHLFSVAPWFASPHFFPIYHREPVIRVIQGNQYHEFGEYSAASFLSSEFLVRPESDRMGYRLRGPHVQLRTHYDMISEAVTFGSVQVPPDGNPIVLMADCQTTGGYPKIAQVVTVDLPVLAQVQAGRHIAFRRITLKTAHDLQRRQERSIRIFANYMRRLLPQEEGPHATHRYQL